MPAAPDRRSTSRIWFFRAAAVLLGLSLFVIIEATCIVFDLAPRVPNEDPFVGFSEVYPLFVLDENGENFEVAKSRRDFFAAETFPAEKQPGTFRIFCLGGSTVQGEPFSIPTAFSTWLELGLHTVEPNRNWEVVNCGGLSYASYRLVPILKECLGHEPDLIVLCTGHNEFLEERTYDQIKHAPKVWTAVAAPLSRLRSFALLRQWSKPLLDGQEQSAEENKFRMKPETDALLDYRDGLKAFHRDEAWKAAVMEHYALNVRRMIAIAREAGVPLLLIRECSNLRDCPPFKSQHRDDLTQDQLKQWDALMERARLNYRNDLPASIRLIKQALEIDDQFAGAHYELGKCYETLRLADDARAAFWQAREHDICPLRMLSPMEEALATIADETNTPLIDAHELLERESDMGILGNGELVDHIHPTFTGHQKIAAALMEEMARQSRVELNGDWLAKCRTAWDKHFKSLDDIYFLRGKEKLDSLMLWTQGRADGPPIESRMKGSGLSR
jgi:lysophospholipase L1-like esterase